MPPKKHTKFVDDEEVPVSKASQALGVDSSIDRSKTKTKSKPSPPIASRRANTRNEARKALKSNGSLERLARDDQININANGTGTGTNSPLPGPLQLDRLKELETGALHFSESDERFGKTSTSEVSEDLSASSNGSSPPETVPDVVPPRTRERKQQIKKGTSSLTKASERETAKKPAKQVYYMSDDEDELELESNNKSKLSAQDYAAKLLEERKTLPIYKARKQVLDHIFANSVTVLLGETGSGKSTQLPQLIYEHGMKERIAITQPRRVAAINLATRVADEMGVKLGSTIGYSVRFQNKTSKGYTHIKYLTDGMLLREMMLDPELKRYTTIILDEAHERTVLTDLLMGLLKLLMQTKRPDLRLVIMSATLDAEKFSSFFDNAPILYVEGRRYHVERFYLKENVEDVVDAMVHAAVQINMSEPQDGDILCFLPGQDEIDRCVDRIDSIKDYLPKRTPYMVALPFYASLPNNLQQRVFASLNQQKRPQRKIIVATNIAETSVTIPGVKYVIDSGLRKIRVWKPILGLDTLLTSAISKASAAQRMGRAGREGPGGKCFRLFTEDVYTNSLALQTEPEIIRSDVTSTVLMLKNVGVDDVVKFPWIESPSIQAITSSLFDLYNLKALDDEGKITKLGKQISLLPVSPKIAVVLIKAAQNLVEAADKSYASKLLSKILDICACLSVEELLVTPRANDRDEINAKKAEVFQGAKQHGDLIMLMDLYQMYLQVPSTSRKEWCKQLGINAKALKSVLLAREQLYVYLKGIINVGNLEQKTKAKTKAKSNKKTTKKIKSDNDGYEDHEDDYDDENQDLEDQDDDFDDYESDGISIPPEDVIRMFLQGFRSNIAVGLPDRRYKRLGSGDQILAIHPSSMLFGQRLESIMYLDYVFTSKSYARMVSPVDLKWLELDN